MEVSSQLIYIFGGLGFLLKIKMVQIYELAWEDVLWLYIYNNHASIASVPLKIYSASRA